jgi:rod shape-determining protein MreD
VSQSFWQRLDVTARHLSPFAFTIVLLIFGLVPLRLPLVPPMAADLVLVSVYYWAIHRPGLMPPFAVFVTGLLMDLLGGGPLGVETFTFLMVYGIALSVRPWLIGATFPLVWASFTMVALAATVVRWLVTSVVVGGLPDPTPGLSGAFFGIGAYPLLAYLFARAQRAFLK